MLERLKDPKNAGSWIITGLVLAIGGYFLWQKFETAGRIIGFVGSFVVLFMLLRLSVTKLLYGVVIVVIVFAYSSWYVKSRTIADMEPQKTVYEHEPWKLYVSHRKYPKYAESGMSQTMQEAVFAPAFMFENVINFPNWRTTTQQEHNAEYKTS